MWMNNVESGSPTSSSVRSDRYSPCSVPVLYFQTNLYSAWDGKFMWIPYQAETRWDKIDTKIAHSTGHETNLVHNMRLEAIFRSFAIATFFPLLTTHLGIGQNEFSECERILAFLFLFMLSLMIVGKSTGPLSSIEYTDAETGHNSRTFGAKKCSRWY